MNEPNSKIPRYEEQKVKSRVDNYSYPYGSNQFEGPSSSGEFPHSKDDFHGLSGRDKIDSPSKRIEFSSRGGYNSSLGKEKFEDSTGSNFENSAEKSGYTGALGRNNHDFPQREDSKSFGADSFGRGRGFPRRGGGFDRPVTSEDHNVPVERGMHFDDSSTYGRGDDFGFRGRGSMRGRGRGEFVFSNAPDNFSDPYQRHRESLLDSNRFSRGGGMSGPVSRETNRSMPSREEKTAEDEEYEAFLKAQEEFDRYNYGDEIEDDPLSVSIVKQRAKVGTRGRGFGVADALNVGLRPNPDEGSRGFGGPERNFTLERGRGSDRGRGRGFNGGTGRGFSMEQNMIGSHGRGSFRGSLGRGHEITQESRGSHGFGLPSELDEDTHVQDMDLEESSNADDDGTPVDSLISHESEMSQGRGRGHRFGRGYSNNGGPGINHDNRREFDTRKSEFDDRGLDFNTECGRDRGLAESGRDHSFGGSVRGQGFEGRGFDDAGRGRGFGDTTSGRGFGDTTRGRGFGDPGRGRGFDDAGRGRRFDDAGRGRGFDDAGRGRRFDDAGRGRGFDDAGRGRGFDDAGRGRGFDDAGRGRGFDDAGRGRGFDDAGRGRRFDDAGRGRGFDDAGRGRGFDDAGRGRGFDDAGRGFDNAGRGRGFDDAGRGRGFDDAGRGRGFGDAGRGRGFDDARRGSGFDDAGRGRGFGDAGRGRGFGDAGRGRGFSDAGRGRGFGDSGRGFDSGRGRGLEFESDGSQGLEFEYDLGQASQFDNTRKSHGLDKIGSGPGMDNEKARDHEFVTNFGREHEYDSGRGRGFDADRGRGRGFDADRGRGRGFDADRSRGRGFDGDRGRGRGFDGDRGRGRGFDADGGRGRGFDAGRGRGRGFDSDRGRGRGFDSDRSRGRGFDSDRGRGRGFDKDGGRGFDSDNNRDLGFEQQKFHEDQEVPEDNSVRHFGRALGRGAPSFKGQQSPKPLMGENFNWSDMSQFDNPPSSNR